MTARELSRNYMNENQWRFMDRRIVTMSRRKLAKEFGVGPTAIWNAIQKLRRDREIKTAWYANGKLSIYEL